MEAAASMRGASILGVVVLLSLLSVGAIVLDSKAPTNSMSQVAQGASVDTPAQEKEKAEPEKTTDGQQITTCVAGYDYATYTEKEETIVACKQAVTPQCKDVTAPKVTTTKGKEKSSGDCSPPKPEYASKMSKGGARSCKEWSCHYYHCDARYPEGCRIMGQAKVGESISSKETVEKAVEEYKKNTSLDEFLKEKQKAEEEGASTGNSPFDQALKKAYTPELEGQLEGVDSERGKQQQIIEEKRQLLERIARGEECATNAAMCTRPEIERVQREKAAAEARLKELDEQKKRLGEQVEKLEPPAPPSTPGENECNKVPRPLKCPPPSGQCSGAQCQEIVVRVVGGGNEGTFGQPSSGYGPAQQSSGQQCSSGNSGGGLGGIFGTIISLFKKSDTNSNCVNGMLVPTCNLTASPQNITAAGQPVQLSWQSQNAYSASLSNAGNIPPQGSMTVQPQGNTTYSMFVQGMRNQQNGQQLSGQCSIQVTVGAQSGGSNDEAP